MKRVWTRWFVAPRSKARNSRSKRTRSNSCRLAYEALEARNLLAVYTVLNTLDSGTDSLRWAIDEANLNPGADSIHFNIPGAGPHTIAPLTGLPTLSEAVTVDGATQPGYSGTPLI
jgi:hypothetical protein